MSSRCVICGDQLDRDRGARGDRCGTCTRFRSRRGVDRSEDHIIKLTEKDIERELRARR